MRMSKKQRGRPPKAPGEAQTQRMVIKLTDSQLEAIEKAAGSDPPTVWARGVLTRAAARKRKKG
jgi:hypothetical protein